MHGFEIVNILTLSIAQGQLISKAICHQVIVDESLVSDYTPFSRIQRGDSVSTASTIQILIHAIPSLFLCCCYRIPFSLQFYFIPPSVLPYSPSSVPLNNILHRFNSDNTRTENSSGWVCYPYPSCSPGNYTLALHEAYNHMIHSCMGE